MMGESPRNEPTVSLGAVQKKHAPKLLQRAIFTAAPLMVAVLVADAARAQEDDAARAQEAAPPTSPHQDQPLAAQEPAHSDLDERAQRHWGSGMAYLDEGEYAKALEAFDKAFQLSGRARILLAIAVTHERRGDLGQAMAALDEYLRLAPNADNAASIRSHRDELQAQHDEQVQRMNDAKQREATEAGPHSSPPSDREPSGSGDQPGPKRAHEIDDTLRWTAFGVGVASGVAATVSGVLALKKYDELEASCGASGVCSERQTQPGLTMAWVSTVLTGVAVAGLGVGLWLTLDSPAEPSTIQAAQQVYVGVACLPSGLTTDVSWSF